MILVDTSAWVEFDRATGSAVDERLTSLIADGAGIAVTEPVLMEVLAGARSDARARDLRRLLLGFSFAPVDSAVDFEAAARIYRTCRRAGVTPRGLVDCLIASVASRSGMRILQRDADLARVAEVIGLPLEATE
ncbi:MAG TPA: PIN domain nuclease [Acidimicrobiales bacterium]|nr:PIN domain nuclease [Acidimicrobiales bacterium]